MEGASRTEDGKRFQIVGAEKEKDRRPISVLIKGTTSWFKAEDLRVLEGLL